MSKSFSKRIVFATLVIVSVATLFVCLQPTISKAIWGGRGRFEGYFDGDYLPYGYNPGDWPANGYVLPPDHSGISIPPSVNSIDTLVGNSDSFLKSHYNQGDPTKSMVSYIVHTMLKVDGEDATRSVTASEWTDVEERLRGPGITISWNEYYHAAKNVGQQATNSGRLTSNKDAFWDTDGQTTTSENKAIVIKHNGTPVYAFFRSCANPDGDLPGLTKITIKPWDIEPLVYVSPDQTTAKPGDTITWTHKVINSGPNATDADVKYRYENGAGTSWGGGNLFPAGELMNHSKQFDDPQLVTQDDVGKTFCRLTSAKPGGRGSDGDLKARVYSAQKCVDIPYNWSMSVKSELIAAPNIPGQTITWKHTVTNDGPTKTNKDVTYHYQNRDGLGDSPGDDHPFPSKSETGSSQSVTSTHLISQDDVGNNLCRATSAQPRAWNNDNWIESSAPCVLIPYNYTLTPGIGLDVAGAIEAGSSFHVTPSVTNTGPTKSNLTQWQITQIVVAPTPGSTVPNKNGGDSAEPPCGTYFQGVGATCSKISSGTTIFNETGARLSGDMIAATLVTVGSYDPGTKLCYAFSLQPHSSSSNLWAHTAPICLVIGKKPKVQIWGGDLLVGGLVTTSTSVKSSGNTFGSWVEYGAIAKGTIKGLASGAAFAGPTGLLNADIAKSSTLSFTNSNNHTDCDRDPTKSIDASVIGCYESASSIPSVAASFPTNTSTPTLSANSSLDTLQGIYKTPDDMTITGGNIQKGRWIVLNAPNADIKITSDINYTTDTLNNIQDIPQVVIIAKNITIDSGVKNIDAWLIATNSDKSGSIYTCEIVGDAIDKCKDKLTVNGPVMTDHLYLRRTYGSEAANPGESAETFNLRADAYLWAFSRASSDSGKIRTVYTTELPPRL